MKKQTQIRAGGLRSLNHSQSVKTSVRAGGLRSVNHSQVVR